MPSLAFVICALGPSSSNRRSQTRKESTKTESRPIVFPIHPLPQATALAFLVSHTHAITNLHCIVPEHPPDIAASKTSLARSCTHADLALLKLQKPLRPIPNPRLVDVTNEETLYRALSPSRDVISLSLIGVKMDIISFSGSRVPVLTFCSHDDTHITKGWSGAPVVNADGDIVGVIAQAYGNLSHAIPSAIIRMLIETSQKDLKIGYVPRLTLQPLYEAFARRAVCPESDVTGVRVAVADVNACLCVNDIITHVCGEEVSNSNTVDWNGIRAPVQALFAGHADENVGVRVIRDGLEAEVVVKVGHADQGVAAVGMDDRMAFCANGVVFTRLSMELMGVLRDEAPWWLTGMAAEDDMDVIIVCQVEGEDSNALGFDSIWLRRAVSVDGKRVRGLQDLVGGKIVEMDNHFVVNIEGGVLRDRD